VKVPGVTSLRYGTNVSPEKKNKGYTHAFVLTFGSDKDRDGYLVHPEHKAFGKVLGPVLEEVIFRGYLLTAGLRLMRRLRPSRTPASSIVAVAVVFSVAHLTTPGTNSIQLGCIMLTGCLYGYIRFRYRSTAAAALAHSAYNLALYISYWCGASR